MNTWLVAVLVGGCLLVGGILAYGVALYNSLVQVRQNIEKAWNNIAVLLQQRHDELPKLVDVCRGTMKQEQQVFETITRLREEYQKAGGIAEKTAIENQLNRQVHGFVQNVEAYPDLKSSQNFLQIQTRVSALESAIADRREFFNDSVNVYNTQILRVPELAVARLFGFRSQAYLEVADKAKQDVKIDFAS